MLDKFYEHQDRLIFRTDDGLDQRNLSHQLRGYGLKMEEPTQPRSDPS